MVVGGYAVMKYAEPRYTKGLDLWIDATPKNARAVFKALKEFGAPLANLTEADFSREGFFYQMGRAGEMKSWGCPWFPFVLELLREAAAKSPSSEYRFSTYLETHVVARAVWLLLRSSRLEPPAFER